MSALRNHLRGFSRAWTRLRAQRYHFAEVWLFTEVDTQVSRRQSSCEKPLCNGRRKVQ